jgi:hypothetical protein
MTKEKSSTLLKGLGIGIVVTQLFDIAIHAVTNQLELLRVFSNIIILVWSLVVIFGKLDKKILPVSGGSIGAYLVLNLVFLALEGVTNPNQGGELRVMLFLLVFLTVGLSTLLTILRRHHGQREQKGRQT